MGPNKNSTNASEKEKAHAASSPNIVKGKSDGGGSPKVGFASPKKPCFQGNKDCLFIEQLSGGILVSHVKKPHGDEAGYIIPALKKASQDEDFADALLLNRVVKRQGADGTTPMPVKPKSEWFWEQLVCIVGVDDVTKQSRLAIAKKQVAALNTIATKEFYDYPKQIRFAGDLTQNPPRTPSDVMLDVDVRQLMMDAFEDEGLDAGELVEMNEAMIAFWGDLEKGKAAMLCDYSKTEEGKDKKSK